MSSWMLNTVILTKNNNQIKLEEFEEDFHAHTGTQIPWSSKSDICQNFYILSLTLNIAVINESNMPQIILAEPYGGSLCLTLVFKPYDPTNTFNSY